MSSTDDIESRTPKIAMTKNTTCIFYDIEVTNTNEIDQISAVSTYGRHMMASMEPSSGIKAFIEWVREVTNGS